MTASPSNGRRAGVLIILLLAVLLIIGGGAAWYYQVAQWRESTDNAYVSGNLVVVAPQIDGTVVWIGAEENDYVEAGQELVRLDENDALNELDLRKHELAQTVREVATLHEQVRRQEAELALQQVTHRLARDEYQRRQRLAKVKMVSEEELDAARSRNDETLGALETARRAIGEARMRAGSMPIQDHPLVQTAAARLRAAYRQWRKTVIVAPVSGHVAQRRVQAGQRVEPASPLLSLAELDSAWVEANFKETQLRHLQIGQEAEIVSDLYGDDVKFTGRVAGIGSGTGSVFALLPPQNATGNWIKILQRVPVRIEFRKNTSGEHPLPLGSSLRVTVDTKSRNGKKLASSSNSRAVAEAVVFGYQTDGFEELLSRLIADNLPVDAD